MGKEAPINLRQLKSVGARKALQRIEEREHLRLEIETRELIHKMQDAAFLLYMGYEGTIDDPDLQMPLSRDRIMALKSAADISGKLLNKVLPDLKQVELSESSDGNSEAVLQDIDLANRLRLYIDAKAKRDGAD